MGSGNPASRLRPNVRFPDSVVGSSRPINHDLPPPLHRIAIVISTPNLARPIRVRHFLTAAGLSAWGVVDIPPPSIDVRDMTEKSLVYKVKLHVAAVEDRNGVMIDVYKKIWSGHRKHARHTGGFRGRAYRGITRTPCRLRAASVAKAGYSCSSTKGARSSSSARARSRSPSAPKTVRRASHAGIRATMSASTRC
jgi:hypothetical protein